MKLEEHFRRERDHWDLEFGFWDGRHGDADLQTRGEKDSAGDCGRAQCGKSHPYCGLRGPTAWASEINFAERKGNGRHQFRDWIFEPGFGEFKAVQLGHGKFGSDKAATLAGPANGIF